MTGLLLACLLSQANPSNLPPPEPISLPENVVGLPAKRTELEDAKNQKYSKTLKFGLPDSSIERTTKATPLPKADKAKKDIVRRGKRNK